MNKLFATWKRAFAEGMIPLTKRVELYPTGKIGLSFILFWIAGFANAARAQNSGNAIIATPIDSWTPAFYLVLIFCFLGFTVLVMQFVLFMRSKDQVSASDVMRAFSTILILISVVALVGVGYSEQQVQPAYGLIGTLLGYVLGRGVFGSDQRVNRQGSKHREVSEVADRETDH